MSIAQWDNEYARLARSASQMRTTGILKSAADVRSLTVGLQQLESELSRWNATSNSNISQSEIQRRRRLIQHLQQTTANFDNTGTMNQSTMGSTDFLGTTTTIGGTGGSMQQQKSQMATAMQQQDAMIDQLAVGVSRLKNQTLAIGEEATLHVNLMTDMESGLDAAHQGLLAETRRAATLREDQSVWRLQLIVAGLSILLLVLIFAGLSP
jgi:outer membrane murein-binding lipoprotein Lpp